MCATLQSKNEMMYFDNAATTPLVEAVYLAMQPYLTNTFGNPSSIHRAGQRAKQALAGARQSVARGIGAMDDEIIFTSGGTEADFLALCGLARASGKNHIVTTAIEHHAVLHACDLLVELGYEVSYVTPGVDGVVRAGDVLQALRCDTGLVSVMWVNNETGAIQPIEELAEELARRGVLFHTDAVQALVSFPIDVSKVPVSSLSFSGHKLFGPKGVGALYLRRGTPYTPMIRGGSQERGRRAGTENLAGVAGFARAMELLQEEREKRLLHTRLLRDRFVELVKARIDEVAFNMASRSAPHIVNVTFEGVLAETLLMILDLEGIAAASGSACTAGSPEPSHVLLAMGLSPERVRSSVRFSFSSINTIEEIERSVDILEASVARIRDRV